VNVPAVPAPVSSPDIHAHRILILDFGAQYTQLIARRIRESGVFCEIHPWDMSDEDVRAFGARGVILSGGPESVTDASPPAAPQAVFELGVPVLGICYGMQTMAQQLGGRVTAGTHREFGYAQVTASAPCRLLDGLRDHSDEQGRALLAVPGEPLRPKGGELSRQLLREGARPCFDVSDVLTAIGLLEMPVPEIIVAEKGDVSEEARAVFDALPPGLFDMEKAIAALPAHSSGVVSAAMMELEISGWLVSRSGRRYEKRE